GGPSFPVYSITHHPVAPPRLRPLHKTVRSNLRNNATHCFVNFAAEIFSPCPAPPHPSPFPNPAFPNQTLGSPRSCAGLARRASLPFSSSFLPATFFWV